jgi:hypothetical protein
MSTKQQPLIGVVDDGRAMLLDLRRERDLRDRDDRAARQPDTALVEHVGIGMDRHPSALLHDRVDRRREGAHVIPVPMADRNALDFAERDSEIGADAYKNRSLGSGIEQQGMLCPADARHQAQS